MLCAKRAKERKRNEKGERERERCSGVGGWERNVNKKIKQEAAHSIYIRHRAESTVAAGPKYIIYNISL